MNAPIQKSRLGRGLASLIGEPAVSQPRIPPEGEQRMVPIGMIRASKNNPRKTFKDDDMVELSDRPRKACPADPGAPDPLAVGSLRSRANGAAGIASCRLTCACHRRASSIRKSSHRYTSRTSSAPISIRRRGDGIRADRRYAYTRSGLADVIARAAAIGQQASPAESARLGPLVVQMASCRPFPPRAGFLYDANVAQQIFHNHLTSAMSGAR